MKRVTYYPQVVLGQSDFAPNPAPADTAQVLLSTGELSWDGQQ